MQSEREGDLSQQLQDIQATGDQAAYQQAMQAMEGDRQARLQEAQFGTSVRGQDIQAFQAGEGALQSQEQMQQQAFQAGEQARQQAAQMGLNAQQQEEAARQAQEKFRQSAFSETQQAAQTAGAQNIQSFQAQQAAAQAAGAQGLQGYQAFQQSQQAAGAQNIQAFQAAEAAKQQAAKLGLSAEQIEQVGKQAAEKYTQSAYDLSSRYGLAAAQGLMQTGQGIQQDALSRMSLLGDVGRQQRALQQASLDMGYQDFLRQRDYAKTQLGMYGGLLRGVPVQPEQTISTYQQQPGLFQTALGAGLSGLGLYRGLGAGAS